MADNLKSFYQHLDKISDRGVRAGLERIEKAMQILGHPDRNYKIIHIAGTNGKGTVCSFIAQLLAKSGYKVGLTLSPHVDDYQERIQVSHQTNSKLGLIPEQDLIDTHEVLLDKLPDSLGLTYFEWGVLLALQYFSDQSVDFAVLETGLGGRWDGSNVITHSVLSGITSIGLDHMDYLGETTQKILMEKLQIVRPKSDFLFFSTGSKEGDLLNTAKKFCEERNTKIHFAKEHYHCFDRELPKDNLPTCFRENLLYALAAGKILEKQGFNIQYDDFLEGDVSLPPARLETISTHPLIIRDGAHNEPALRLLKAYLEEKLHNDYDLVFGCLKSRDFLKLAKIVLSSHQNYWTEFEAGPRTASKEVYDRAKALYGGEVVSIGNHLKNQLLSRKKSRPVLVCGSFYLCSQFKEMWETGSKV